MNNANIVEEWRDIKGYEGNYMVSNLGRVKSLVGWNGHKYIKRDKILNPYKQEVGQGYHRSVVKLHKNGKKKDAKVHRLVADAFIPNPENKPNINHKDGNPLNNIVSNLEWCSQKENVTHAIETGLRNLKHIPKKELERLYIEQKKSPREIGEMFNVSRSLITNRIKKYNIKKRTHSESKIQYNLTRKFIIEELKTKTQAQLAKEVGCDQSLISHYYKKIKNGEDLYEFS